MARARPVTSAEKLVSTRASSRAASWVAAPVVSATGDWSPGPPHAALAHALEPGGNGGRVEKDLEEEEVLEEEKKEKEEEEEEQEK